MQATTCSDEPKNYKVTHPIWRFYGFRLSVGRNKFFVKQLQLRIYKMVQKRKYSLNLRCTVEALAGLLTGSNKDMSSPDAKMAPLPPMGYFYGQFS